ARHRPVRGPQPPGAGRRPVLRRGVHRRVRAARGARGDRGPPRTRLRRGDEGPRPPPPVHADRRLRRPLTPDPPRPRGTRRNCPQGPPAGTAPSGDKTALPAVVAGWVPVSRAGR